MSGEKELRELSHVYPKRRPPLTARHEEVYVREYKENRSGKGLLFSAVAGLESWMHRQVSDSSRSGSILEIGAGTLNHLSYERAAGAYDVIEPFQELYTEAPHRGRIRRFFSDMKEVPAGERYDRIISVAVLEHLTLLPDVVARAGILLADHGEFSAGIPTEGGALWGLSWRFTTGVAYRLRTGLPYGTLMRHEHVNTERDILKVVRCFFSRVKVNRFPVPLRHLSFYTAIHAEAPLQEKCHEWLASSRPDPAAP